MSGGFVELENVSLRYGGEETGTLALSDANLKVDQGDFIAVVGPSGCGKSTLMKAMSGLWPVTSGGVRVAGQYVNGPLSIVGMAFQAPTLLPWRNTLDNVMLPLEIAQPFRSQMSSRKEEFRDKARSLLKLVGLEGFDQKFPWQLSGGMQQRVSLCRALIHEPELLMLDEPFAALDMFTREELWGVLQNVWLTKKPTVILVTHDLREAVYLADKVYVMSARPGRMIHERDIEFARPRELDITFQPDFGDIAHDLRDHIYTARAEPVESKAPEAA